MGMIDGCGFVVSCSGARYGRSLHENPSRTQGCTHDKKKERKKDSTLLNGQNGTNQWGDISGRDYEVTKK